MTDLPAFHDHLPEPIAITFSLEEHGWASMKVCVGRSDVELGTFGYCTDALGDLVRAAVAMATGATDAEVVFNGEPILWGVAIRGGWQSTLQPQAHRFSIRTTLDVNGTEHLQVSSWPNVLAQGYVTVDAFAAAVSKAAHDVLAEHGEKGYLARWVLNPFPARGLAALDAALALPPPPTRSGSPL